MKPLLEVCWGETSSLAGSRGTKGWESFSSRDGDWTSFVVVSGSERPRLPAGEAPNYPSGREALEHFGELARRDQDLRLRRVRTTDRQHGEHLRRDAKLHVGKFTVFFFFFFSFRSIDFEMINVRFFLRWFSRSD